MSLSKNKYNSLLKEIRQLVEQARQNVVGNINTELLLTYWNVGRLIVAKEKQKKFDDVSLTQMFIELSKELTRELWKGFSRSNLFAMRSYHLRFSMDYTVLTPSGQKVKTQKKLTFPANPNKILVSKYQLYLPDKKLLKKKIKELFA